MRKVLNDPNLENQFQKDGYVEIPFITSDEVEELKKNFFDLLPKSGGNITDDETDVSRRITYDFTFIDRNPEFKQAVFDAISAKFAPHVKKWLADYRPIIANYIRKQPDGGEVPVHENWAFIDEQKATSVSIWCPLVDSDESNGTLEVVPGSHKRFGEFRGPMIPWECEGITEEIKAKHLVPLPTKAGNAVILDDSIVHYTKINSTPNLRLAIQLILVPTEMKCIHYHMDQSKSKDQVEVLEVDVPFFMNFNPWKKPDEEKRIRSFKYTPYTLTEQEFAAKLNQPRFDEQRGFFSRIKEALSFN